MKNFVINLKRQPEKFDNFLKLNAGAGIAFERYEACDGAALAEQDAIDMKIVVPGTKFSKGSIGCAVSHYRLWQQAVEINEPILVFEDDAAVRDDFNGIYPALLAALESWDYFTFGYNTDSILDIEWARGMTSAIAFAPRQPSPANQQDFVKSTPPVAAYRLNNCFGTCGYAISPSGARRLLKHCFPMNNRQITIQALKRTFPAFNFDCILNDVYGRIEAYACFPPLVLPKNDVAVSTTMRA
jgi:GR25 family glycosyltransferase involved in LPS biosynthesis